MSCTEGEGTSGGETGGGRKMLILNGVVGGRTPGGGGKTSVLNTRVGGGG